VASRLAEAALPFDAAQDLGQDAKLVEALAAVIGDRDIVMLGEPSHGDGSSIRLRGRLVELLHRRFGFDVLAFEADFWSLTRGWEAISEPAQIRPFADGNLYDFWGRAPAVDGLWTYVEAVFAKGGRLDVCGFDCRLKGEMARENLTATLRSTVGANLSDEQFKAFADGYAALQTAEFAVPPPKELQEGYFASIDQMITALQQENVSTDAVEQAQAELLSLAAWARVAWKGRSRDEAMAANLEWLVTQKFPGREVIVWAHNNHILKNPTVYLDIRDPGPAQQIAAMSEAQKAALSYVGSVSSRTFPGRVCAIATTLGRGETSALFYKALDGSQIDFTVTRHVPAHGSDSIEALLLEKNAEAALLDLRDLSHADFFRSRLIDLSYPADAPFGRGYDAAIYLRDGRGLA